MGNPAANKTLPDTIIFHDKQSLYRREAGKVIAFPWRQVAAAAVLIAFGIWGGSVYFNNKTKTGDAGVVKNIQPKKSAGNIAKPVAPPDQIKVSVEPSADEQEQALVKAPDEKEKSTVPKPAIQSPKKVEARRMIKEEMQSPVVIEKTNNLPKPYSDNLNKIGSNENVPAYVTIQKQSGDIEDPGINETGKNKGNQDPAKLYAAYRPDNGEEINNDHVLFMDEEKIKKTKLGGIFRKVKRVLERKVNIKPGGNNIKVANLEFAIQ